MSFFEKNADAIDRHIGGIIGTSRKIRRDQMARMAVSEKPSTSQTSHKVEARDTDEVRALKRQLSNL